MVIEYERTEGDSRTLSIKFDAGGRFSGAEVSLRSLVATLVAVGCPHGGAGSRSAASAGRAVLTLFAPSPCLSLRYSSCTPTLTSRTSWTHMFSRKTCAPSSRRCAPGLSAEPYLLARPLSFVFTTVVLLVLHHPYHAEGRTHTAPKTPTSAMLPTDLSLVGEERRTSPRREARFQLRGFASPSHHHSSLLALSQSRASVAKAC